MVNLRGASPVCRDEGGHSYAAHTISRGVGRNGDDVARQSPRHERAAGTVRGNGRCAGRVRDHGERDGSRADWVSAGKTGRCGLTVAARDKPGRRRSAGSGQASWAAQAGWVGKGVAHGDGDKPQLPGLAQSNQGGAGNPGWCGWPGRLGTKRLDRGG